MNASRREIMSRFCRFTFASATLLSFAFAASAGDAIAQQKQVVSFKVPAENSKFIVSQNVARA
jgi:hypothetical protein